MSPALAAALAEGCLARARGDPEGVVVALDPLLALGLARLPGGARNRAVGRPSLRRVVRPRRGEARRRNPRPVRSARRQARAPRGAARRRARARGTLEAARGDTEAAERAFRLGLRHSAHVEAPSTGPRCTSPTAVSCGARESAPWRASSCRAPATSSSPWRRGPIWSAATRGWPRAGCAPPQGRRRVGPGGSSPRRSVPSPAWWRPD
ncbi:hypothetical protein ACRAWF_47045 [Streptomyces sp. L7]